VAVSRQPVPVQREEVVQKFLNFLCAFLSPPLAQLRSLRFGQRAFGCQVPKAVIVSSLEEREELVEERVLIPRGERKLFSSCRKMV
jgi:hypothetical protein